MRALNIAVVVGDIGGCKELLPVVKILEQRGHTIAWHADSSGRAGTDVLTKAGIPFDNLIPGDHTICDIPDLILVGTSATATRSQSFWTDFGNQKTIPVIWFEDLYGTAQVGSANKSSTPDTIIVIDDVAAQIAKNARPSVNIFIGGKPTYGSLHNRLAGVFEERKQVRKYIGITAPDGTPVNHFLTTYVSMGEDPDRVEKHIRAIGYAVQCEKPKDLRIALRFHPKLKAHFEKFNALAQEHVGDHLVDTTVVSDTLAMIVASDVVIADYGGDAPYQAALLGKPVIVTMFPECSDKLVARGYPNGIPPILRAGGAIAVTDKHWLSIVLKGALHSLAPEFGVWREVINLLNPLIEPGASERIADIIEKEMSATTTE
jgi:hypothetical protein